jgi:hypothetical protein
MKRYFPVLCREDTGFSCEHKRRGRFNTRPLLFQLSRIIVIELEQQAFLTALDAINQGAFDPKKIKKKP